LRVALAYRCLLLGGVLIHSATVGSPDGARLFFGHSGAGKSTLSRLASTHGFEVLSDDLNVVLPSSSKGSSWSVWVIPFTGDFAPSIHSGRRLPLIELYRLDQAPSDEATPLAASEAVAALLSVCPYVNQDPHRRAHLWPVLGGLAGLGAKSLRFTATPESLIAAGLAPARLEN